MKILGISDSHEAAACLFIDGELICAVAEERFSKLKSDMGYPLKAIDYCLSFSDLSPNDLDAVVLATLNSPASHIRTKREATFTIEDWVDEQNLYWKKKLNGEVVSYHKIFSNNTKYIKDQYYNFSDIFNSNGEVNQEAFRKERVKKVEEHLNIKNEIIHFATHEQCHSYYGYYGSELRKDALVFTCEGEGDYSNSTVSIANSLNGLKEICNTKENHLAHFYRYITLILGMKPNQHEYKVMGLAPYASDYEKQKCLQIFKDLLKIEDGNIVVDKKIPDRYFYFIEKFQGLRFDGIASALQEYLEETLQKWVLYHVNQTGISNIVFSGGVAQNIKAMKAIKDLDEINSVYVNPISGDGSLSIGACYNFMKENFPKLELHSLGNIYLGPSFNARDVENAMQDRNITKKYEVIKNPSVERVASLLADDKILARCVGRMEFGQRALGNRSILANPSNQDNLRKINRQIKGRDFWMPFTPSILDYRAEDYIINPVDSHFMSVAFDSTNLARKDLVAAIHPADFTVRPQILTKERNQGYFDLIKAFEKITGVGGLLNTSLNLHGEPIVCDPNDAFHTFEDSLLDGVVFDDYLVLRK